MNYYLKGEGCQVRYKIQTFVSLLTFRELIMLLTFYWRRNESTIEKETVRVVFFLISYSNENIVEIQ